MPDHLRLLRIYYLALEHNLVAGGNRSLEVHWTEEMVRDWLAVFRLPPFADRYRILSRDAPCPNCGRASHNGKYTLMTFPGGHKSACRECGEQWLTLENNAPNLRLVPAETKRPGQR
jgi:hypothetical protein